MPTRAELEDALRKADAAGAKEDAQRLADALSSMPVQPSAPARVDPMAVYDQMAATQQRSVVGTAPQWDMLKTPAQQMIATATDPGREGANQIQRGWQTGNIPEMLSGANTKVREWWMQTPDKDKVETLGRIPIEATGVGTYLRLENEAARRKGEPQPNAGFEVDESYRPETDLAGLMLNAGTWSTRSAGGGLINPRSAGAAVKNAVADVATNMTMGASDAAVAAGKMGAKTVGGLAEMVRGEKPGALLPPIEQTAVPVTTRPQAAPAAPPQPPTPPAGTLTPVQPTPVGQVSGDFAKLHPKVQSAFERLLVNSGVEPQRIPNILRELDKLPPDRAEMVATQLIEKFGAGDPKLQTNITSVAGDLAVNAPKAGGDNAQAIVRGNVRKYMDQEIPYVEGVAERNFGPGAAAMEADIEGRLKDLRGKYQKVLSTKNPYGAVRSPAKKAEIDTARKNLSDYLRRVDTSGEIPDWLKRDTIHTLNRDLREMGLPPVERNAATQGFTWGELVDQYPTQIAHALQSTYATAIREADIAKLGDVSAGAMVRDLTEMRGKSQVRKNAANPADRGYGLLHLLEQAAPGYKDLRTAYGTEHGLKTALNVPERFLSAVNDERKFTALLDDLDQMSPEQFASAQNQITTLVKNAIRKKQENPTLAEVGAGERGTIVPNFTTLAQAPVLEGLEKAFGEKGKELADAIRLSRAATETVKKWEPDFGPRTASNLKNAESAPALYENPLATDRNIVDNTTALMGTIGATQLFTQPHIAAGLMGMAGVRAIWQAIKNGRKLSPEQRSQFAQFLFALRRGEAPEEAARLIGPDGPGGPPQIPGPDVPPISGAATPALPPADLPPTMAAQWKPKNPAAQQEVVDLLKRQSKLKPGKTGDAEYQDIDQRIFDIIEADQAGEYPLSSPKPPPVKAGFFGSGSKPLDMSEAGRMQRAREQGFTIDAYHGTSEDITEFGVPPPFRAGMRNDDAIFFAADPDLGSSYATWRDRRDTPKRIEAQKRGDDYVDTELWNDRILSKAVNKPVEPYREGANVMPVKLRMRNPLTFDAKGRMWSSAWPDAMIAAKRGGHDGVIMKNVDDWGDGMMGREARSKWEKLRGKERALRTVYAIFDANNVRSKFAAFDPSQSGSSKLLAGMGKGTGGRIASQVGPPAFAATVASVGPEGEPYEDKLKRMGLAALATSGARNAGAIMRGVNALKGGAKAAERVPEQSGFFGGKGPPKPANDMLPKGQKTPAEDLAMAREFNKEPLTPERAYDFWVLLKDEKDLNKVIDVLDINLNPSILSLPRGRAMVERTREEVLRRVTTYLRKETEANKASTLSRANAKFEENNRSIANEITQLRERGVPDQMIARSLGLEDGSLEYFLRWSEPTKPPPAQAGFFSGGKGLTDTVADAYGSIKRGLFPNDPRHLNPAAEALQAMDPKAQALVMRNASQLAPRSAIEAAETPPQLAELVGRAVSQNAGGADKPIDAAAKSYQTRLAEMIMEGQRNEADLINMDRKAGPIGALEKGVKQSYDWTPGREAEQEALLSAILGEGEKGIGGVPERAGGLDRFREGIMRGSAQEPLMISPRDENKIAQLIFDPGSASEAARLMNAPVKPWVSDLERKAIQVGVPATGLAAMIAAGASLYNQPGGQAGQEGQPPKPAPGSGPDQPIYTVPDRLMGTSNPSEPPPELNGFNRDTRVRAQQRLMALGYAPQKLKPGVRFDDGVDGEATRAAVMRFQRENDLPVTGDLDPMTLRALWGGKNYSATPTMRAYGEELAPAPR